MGFTTSEVQQARDACAAFYEAFKAGDVDEMVRHYSPDCVVIGALSIWSDMGTAMRGVRICGRDELAENLNEWFRMFNMEQLDIEVLTADGGANEEGVVVMALVRGGATCKQTGKSWRDHREAHAILVKDGLIARLADYSDPAEIAAACERGEYEPPVLKHIEFGGCDLP